MAPRNAGKAIMTNARPSIAGLKMFCPSPPKMIFPTPMATNAPIAPTYHGAVAGSENARIAPVTAADPSFRQIGLRRMAVKSASAASALTTQRSTWMTA